MAKSVISNIPEVAKEIGKLKDKYGPVATSVIVFYSANYALQVHENLTAHHVNGEAKYLERPAREKRVDISATVREATIATKDLEKGLIAGGLLLQRESQKLVPVDTGNLRGSADTKAERFGR